MLKKDNIIFIGIACVIFMNSSCSNSPQNKEYVQKNFKTYSGVHKIICDSLNLYVNSSLSYFLSIYCNDWSVDSMICINSSNDKLFTSINISSGIGSKGTSDAAEELLGKKINGKWYFFSGGGTLIIPRDMYGKNEMNPLSFYELSQIARKQMMESALVKKNGEYVVDDEWIDEKFYNIGWGRYSTRAEYDSIHWKNIMRKWTEKIDTNEYKPLKRHKPVL